MSQLFTSLIEPKQHFLIRFLVLALFLNPFQIVNAQDENISLVSPNDDIELSFFIHNSPDTTFQQGQLLYTITYKDHILIKPSSLNLELKNRDIPIGTNVTRVEVNKESQRKDNYKLITGRNSRVSENYNSVSIKLMTSDSQSIKFEIIARAYNDGVAFRYMIPDQLNISDINLVDEHTEFRFTDDAKAYAQLLPNYQSMYEAEYIPLPITSFGNQGGIQSAEENLIGLPLLLDIPNIGWATIIDADLENYASTYLKPTGSWTEYQFQSSLAPKLEQPGLAITSKLPFQTSWKTIMIADDPGRFLESNIITSLNPPSKIEDTSWIKAGKAAWDWWSGSLNSKGKTAYTTENMKRYVDFASEAGFKYMLIDAGWSGEDLTKPLKEKVDVPKIVRYAQKKDVKVWIWAFYKALDKQMDEAFAAFQKWGVAGVKIDFIERDDQKGIAFYYKAAKKAAQHHLMLDFHGSTKPTGIERTWPNVLGYEAVVGMEQSKAGRRDNPKHHVMLPYTRMITGLMDYTPGGFDNVTRENFEPRMQNPMVMGTRAHVLAMYVIYESPFQMVADHPSAYRNEPAFEFIKNVPTNWDQTRVLNGVPGEYITVVRQQGDQWFLGSMTNEDKKAIEIPLSFLANGQYTATIYRDTPESGDHPKQVAIEEKEVNTNSTLDVKLVSGGGCAIKFTPE